MASNNGGNSFWPQFEDNKLFAVLLSILIVYGIVLTGAVIRQTLLETKYIGLADRQPGTIVVSAVGKSKTAPDLATIDFSVTSLKPTAAESQAESTSKSNAMISALKALGIADEDIKTTGVNTSEERDYQNAPAKILGYRTDSSLSVKLHDTAKVGVVLSKLAELGATNINGPRFELENQDAALASARQEALAKAKKQADEIAAAMGARLGGVVTYNESSGGGYPMYDRALTAAAPMDKIEIAPGQTEVNLNVSVTYSIY